MLGSTLNLGLTERLNNLGNGNFVNTWKPKGHAPVKELSQAIIQGFCNRNQSVPENQNFLISISTFSEITF